MPHTVAADGTHLHYDLAGRRSGEPILCLQGLGVDRRGWSAQRLALGARHRLILMDNRGAGRSGKPVGSYDLEVMADDARRVLTDAGYDSAHVMGASMGGAIAQI